MDPIERLNESVAALLGWQKDGLRWQSRGSDGKVEVRLELPQYTDNFLATLALIEYARKQRTEFSLFMMLYDREPIWMASFIRGLSQRSSTGNDPMLAICKAFVMMFAPDPN